MTHENDSVRQLAADIFRRKRERRRQLAKLSFEEKIDLLIRMQNLAWQISQQMHRPGKKPWRFIEQVTPHGG